MNEIILRIFVKYPSLKLKQAKNRPSAIAIVLRDTSQAWPNQNNQGTHVGVCNGWNKMYTNTAQLYSCTRCKSRFNVLWSVIDVMMPGGQEDNNT